jgi:hypothetical protein
MNEESNDTGFFLAFTSNHFNQNGMRNGPCFGTISTIVGRDKFFDKEITEMSSRIETT